MESPGSDLLEGIHRYDENSCAAHLHLDGKGHEEFAGFGQRPDWSQIAAALVTGLANDLERVGNHKRCGINYDPSHFLLQALDYLEFIDIYHERIYAFHVKDAELNPTGRQGVFSGFQDWVNRAGRFRSLGDGQVDFGGIFSKLTAYNYDSWAVLEWECCLKHPEDGAREGAEFIKHHIIRVTEKSFEDFAAGGEDQAANRRALGLDR